MHSYDNETETDRLLREGFGKLSIDDVVVEYATEKILLRIKQKEQSQRHNLVLFQRRYWLAYAASLLIAVGIVTIFINDMNKPNIADHSAVIPPVTGPVSIISYINSSDTGFSGIENIYSTTDSSQLLLGIGQRIRTVLFEKTSLKVINVNSFTSTIKLDYGTIAVDVKKLHSDDSITIITPYGTFTNIGTRFSVFADSVQGAEVEVYSGTVRVTTGDTNTLLVQASSVWRSSNAGVIDSLKRSDTDIKLLADVFNADTLKETIKWKSTRLIVFDSVKNNVKVKNHKREIPKILSGESAVERIKTALIEKHYVTLDSLLRSFNQSDAGMIYELMLTTADRHHMKSQYDDEVLLRVKMVSCQLFSIQQREAASATLLYLHKNYLRTAPATLLSLIRTHRKTYTEGTFDEDIGAEEVTILIKLDLYSEAIECLKRLLGKYPKSSHGDYWRYVYATLLRERPGFQAEALDAYEMYILHNPDGKYLEEAMYWTVDLSYSLRLRTEYLHAKKRYLHNFPSGRWVEVIQAHR